jgi:hypothetical protein
MCLFQILYEKRLEASLDHEASARTLPEFKLSHITKTLLATLAYTRHTSKASRVN